MNIERKTTRKIHHSEKGAALVTVLMISVLLGVACIALLSAVGANSKNSTDVLSETKAYYAAESGLQATINALRNDSTVDYKYAAANPTLSAKLPYNYPIGSPTRAVIGGPANTYNPNTGAAYSVVVSDPDNSAASLTFNTSGTFTSYSVVGGATFSTNRKTIYIPNQTASPRTEITFNDVGSTTNTFIGNPSLGSFSISNVGAGVQLTGEIQFEINYRMTLPRTASKVIYGYVRQAAPTVANPTPPKLITFQSQNYELIGSRLELCSSPTATVPCADVSFNLTTTPTPTLYASITAVAPNRLKVVSTGYGPNGARKQLEGIIRNDLLNGLSSAAATTLIGPFAPPFRFEPGTSNGITYSGGNCASSVGCVPSFGLTNTGSLNYVTNNPPGPAGGNPQQAQPPPALLDPNTIPEWQQSPATLEQMVNDARQRLLISNRSRYFVNPTGNQANFTVGTNQNPPGSFANGTGITFCEGSCNIGADGGGILIVTGKLTNVGGFSFKGVIIVVGEEGWERNGAGNGQLIGNVIVAPYVRIPYQVPLNYSATFLPPQYYVTGGGNSDVIYNDVSATLNNTSAISDLMIGVAEK